MTTPTAPIAIAFPFRFLNGQVNQTRTYDQLVRAQVIDALMTNWGERVFRPMHGCDIQTALFDPRDELTRHDAAGIIKGRLADLVPRAEVLDLQIDTTPPNSIIYINVQYRSSKYGPTAALSVPISGSEFITRDQPVLGGIS